MGHLNQGIRAAQSYLKQKKYEALLASLQEIHGEAETIKPLQELALRLQPVVRELITCLFQQHLMEEKKKIINAFLRLKQPLLALQTLSEDKQLTKKLNELEWELEEFEKNLFKADTEKELLHMARSLTSLFSLLSTISPSITGAEGPDQPLRQKKLAELKEGWNFLMSFILDPLEKAFKRIAPSTVFMRSREGGAEGIEIR